MTSAFVDQDIRADEGFRSHAYPDPLTGAEPWTVGFGATGEGIGPNTIWSLAQAVQDQSLRRQQIEAALDHAIPWWRSMNDYRQDVLANMAYNMGVTGLLEFHRALAAMKAGDWATASEQMLDSDWPKQVGRRAYRLAEQMRTGVRAGPGSAVSGVDATKAAIGAA